MNNFDVLVIGAGFAGSVVARKLAEEKNKKVLLIDKRPQIGGNMYECYRENGVRVHLYGPHIFHTNNKEVFEYLQRFGEFYLYEHKVIGRIDGELVPIPFSFKSLEMLFEEEKAETIKEKLKKYFANLDKVSILELINHEDDVIKEFGKYVYEKVFVNYTAKQWGVPVEEVDNSVINRVPVNLGYDERYFKDEIQYMPKEGFTKLFENMLNHPNIEVRLDTNAKDIIKLEEENKKIYVNGEIFDKPIYFTGAVDELLNYKYGQLPYRSLNLVFEDYDKTNFQPNSVVNYPNEEDFTRITEFKYLTNQKLEDKTTILKEYPLKYDAEKKDNVDPYYPIINDENREIYNKYKEEILKYNNIKLIGRLAEYRYYNMDAVIEKALEICK